MQIYLGHHSLTISTFFVLFVFQQTGKTNHGQKLYGRAIRHKDVRLCAVGATAFMLAMRFSLTSEFVGFSAADWLNNQTWFDVKLLVDATRNNWNMCRPMTNDTYSKAVKSVLDVLGVPSSHWVHLGRTMGPKILEMLETEAEDIRRLGNWDPTMQEARYSTKLPLPAMRDMAGFTTAAGMYFNPRTVVKPSQDLMMKTPFRFAIPILDEVEREVNGKNERAYTALSFLRFLKEMSQIFLQDAATIWLFHEDRKAHPIFMMDVFRSVEWEVSLLFSLWIFVLKNLTCGDEIS